MIYSPLKSENYVALQSEQRAAQLSDQDLRQIDVGETLGWNTINLSAALPHPGQFKNTDKYLVAVLKHMQHQKCAFCNGFGHSAVNKEDGSV